DRPLRPQLLAGAHRLAVRGPAGDGHDRSARPVDVHAHRRHRRSRGRDRAGAAGDGARLRPGWEPFVKDSSLTQSAPASRDLGQARAGSPAIMAVINRTTDSFYESAATLDEAIAAVEAAAADGAQIVDIGGVRAGRGREISVAEEIDRVCPTIEAVAAAHPQVLISVDTWRHEVADAACRAGAGLLNDTWAGTDPKRGGEAAGHDDGTLAGVLDLASAARAAGVPEDRIIIDPTPDFGKNTYQSLRLLRDLDRFVDTGYPVLLAVSRKDFVGEAIGDVPPQDRLHGT